MTTDTDDVFERAAALIWLAFWPFAGLWFLGIVGCQFLHWLLFGTWKEIPFVAVPLLTFLLIVNESVASFPIFKLKIRRYAEKLPKA